MGGLRVPKNSQVQPLRFQHHRASTSPPRTHTQPIVSPSRGSQWPIYVAGRRLIDLWVNAARRAAHKMPVLPACPRARAVIPSAALRLSSGLRKAVAPCCNLCHGSDKHAAYTSFLIGEMSKRSEHAAWKDAFDSGLRFSAELSGSLIAVTCARLERGSRFARIAARALQKTHRAVLQWAEKEHDLYEFRRRAKVLKNHPSPQEIEAYNQSAQRIKSLRPIEAREKMVDFARGNVVVPGHQVCRFCAQLVPCAAAVGDYCSKRCQGSARSRKAWMRYKARRHGPV